MQRDSFGEFWQYRELLMFMVWRDLKVRYKQTLLGVAWAVIQPLVSTLIGSSLDTILFFTVAFSGALAFIEPANDVSWATEVLPLLGAGPMVPLWVSLATADWLVKLSLAIVALVPFRVIVGRLTERVA